VKHDVNNDHEINKEIENELLQRGEPLITFMRSLLMIFKFDDPRKSENLYASNQ
jgi:hypothetical protein